MTRPSAGMLDAYQRALAEWLGRGEYDTWCTWTFGAKWPAGPSPESVQRHVLGWIERQKIQRAYVVAERGMSAQRRWHAHGLIATPDPLLADFYRKQWWRDWFERYGRCSFWPLDEKGGARLYVAKYCQKGMPVRWWVTSDGRFE